MNRPDRPLEQRVELLEHEMSAFRKSLRDEVKKAAHELVGDSDFSKPYWESGADHMGNHFFDKAARRLLWLVLGIFGAAGLGLAMWLGGKGFK